MAIAPRSILPLLLCVLIASFHSSSSSDVKLGYWLASRPIVSSANLHLYTHLTYAFAQLDPSFQISPQPDDNGNIAQFTPAARALNPAIVTLIAIGGGGSNSTRFAEMAAAPSSRATFINSSIALARANGFHGLDLDWEFPQSQREMSDLAALWAEWRAAIQAEATATSRAALLLTAAVYYRATVQNVGAGTYPVDAVNANLDWVGLMAFDYHGAWDPTTVGPHTALYNPDSSVNTDAGVTSWLGQGLHADRAVLGLAMYGRSWILASNESTGIGAAAVGVPADSTPFFRDIVSFIRDNNATAVYDNTTVTAYCFGGGVWIGFDSPVSIATKVEYLKSRALKGYFFWTAGYDSSTGALANAASATLDSR
ncbi:hypothetical protein SELMODRAFT_410071 [Selaginella moellendorffii]|uniref:GH18 domain-containing protein n=1 Tax=Selaginella moellendorffii TaxID=88036 RepID=D8RDD7_SELML|nr:class V chitinase [Selaginella moellendorffii]EFJ30004.1 hypothetical protein SELMODRAFT_410071 [Selaginella moellendorffii]|eukprot:XP_002968888.1 class V chitinase [Selaginella moellendorffii]